MVQLNSVSPLKSEPQSTLTKWESLRRAKYNYYEARIKQSVEAIQKINNGNPILRLLFPSFAQSDLAELEITRRLQTLGDYTEDEVAAYKEHNGWIKYHLDSTFGTPFPYCGSVFGLAIAAYTLPKRLNAFMIVAISACPALLEMCVSKWNPRHKYETLKFLDWAIERRTAKVNLERFASNFNEIDLRDFRRNFPNKTVLTAYNEYLSKL